MKILIGMMSTIIAISSTWAIDLKYDPTAAFVKMNQNLELPKSSSIKSSKHLFGNVYLVKTNDLLKLENELKQNQDVQLVERNYIAEKKKLPDVEPAGQEDIFLKMMNFGTFNDPEVGRIWSFMNEEDNGVSVYKSYLSPLGFPKNEVIVAVVDTGVDYNHEDLKDVMWVNANEIPGNNIDDDNNGYVDDIHGIDAISRNSDGSASGNPMGSHPHGTHVSGTIAATQNNGIGIAGIASNVKIMAIRAVPDSSDETDLNIVESFLYAAKNGAKIINCSFGKELNEGGMIVSETIDHIGKEYGVLVLAASGNEWGRNIDENPKYPASFESENLMVVSSTSQNGTLSWFSNIGPKSVDVVAPGSAIYSTIKDNKYAKMSGTSMATPTTAGVAAEVLSHFPELTPVELKKVLMDSVVKKPSYESVSVSGGRVDLFKALQLALRR